MKQCLLLACFCLISSSLFAHGEQIKLSDQPLQAVKLSKKQQQAMDLHLSTVNSMPMQQKLSLNGQIILKPDAQAYVSVRISGSVTALLVNLGDEVKAGQKLAVVQSRLIGNPPPSVDVYATMAGIIDARNVKLGEAVEPNTVLFHISNRNQLLVLAKVYEEDLAQVQTGQKVLIKVLSYPKQGFTGTVSLIEPNLDTNTRTVNIQISLQNEKNLLKPGMFARAELIIRENPLALAIPTEAILYQDHHSLVFVKKGDDFDKITIKTGATDGLVTEVLEGLKAGDQVVTRGNRQLFTIWLSGGIDEHEDHH